MKKVLIHWNFQSFPKSLVDTEDETFYPHLSSSFPSSSCLFIFFFFIFCVTWWWWWLNDFWINRSYITWYILDDELEFNKLTVIMILRGKKWISSLRFLEKHQKVGGGYSGEVKGSLTLTFLSHHHHRHHPLSASSRLSVNMLLHVHLVVVGGGLTFSVFLPLD